MNVVVIIQYDITLYPIIYSIRHVLMLPSCRCLISCHAEVQEKVFAELQAAGLSCGRRPFAATDVAKLPYLANVIKEAMRVNPAIPQVNR